MSPSSRRRSRSLVASSPGSELAKLAGRAVPALVTALTRSCPRWRTRSAASRRS